MFEIARAGRLAAALLVMALVAAACGGDDAGIEVEDAWARPSPGMANAGAVYMNVTSGDSDRLVGASVDASVAGKVEIHETVAADMSDAGESDEEEGMGAMMMQEVGSISLPAGETVALEPGGLHIMLLDLVSPLEEGTRFDVTLQFEEAESMGIEVEVRSEAP